MRRGAISFAAILLVGGAAVAAASILGPPTRRVKLRLDPARLAQVAPTELAQWIIEGRRDFVLVDLRKDAAYDAGHVRGAVHCGTCHADKKAARDDQQGQHFVDLSKKLVLYDDTGATTLELPPIVARNPRLFVLAGGWDAWRRDILAPVEIDREDSQLREVVRAFFAGERPATGTVAPLPITPVKRENAHKPAGPSEGC